MQVSNAYNHNCFINVFILDGQKIAKRLSKNITKETAAARKILTDYNSIVSPSTGSINTLEEVLSPDSGFWNNQQSPAISSVLDTLSWDAKKDIIQAYLLVK